LFSDRTKLQEVFVHLLSNSYRFTPEGGSITITTANFERAGRRFVRIRIEDTGIGVPVEQQKIIFYKYGQVTLRQGTGLSLTLSDHLMRAMAGEVYIDSAYSGGAYLAHFE
jgi:signal transduction histidine kinase